MNRLHLYRCPRCGRDAWTKDRALLGYWQRRGHCARCARPTEREVVRSKLDYLMVVVLDALGIDGRAGRLERRVQAGGDPVVYRKLYRKRQAQAAQLAEHLKQLDRKEAA
jgi:hypothetical protein